MKPTHLTMRALILSVCGSLLITASSMYVALRMSALPWPTVFVSILSLSLIKLFKHGSIHEVNVAQTGMSSGAMVAGGVAFTIPGLWISGIFENYNPATMTFAEWALPKFWIILLSALAGTIAGSAICYVNRKKFIEKDALPFPIGTAATETIKAGDTGGKKSLILFLTMGVVSLFTILRDIVTVAGKSLIPQGFKAKVKGFPLEFTNSPMAVGIGYIIGFFPCLWWLLGALLSHYVFDSLGVANGTFADIGQSSAFSLSVAVGLMVGSGVGILVQLVQDIIKKRREKKAVADEKEKHPRLVLLLTAAVTFALSVLARIPVLPSVLLIFGTVFTCYLSANITGQTGINPMELFAILVLLAIRIFVQVDNETAFFICCIVAVASGFAGDMLNDYKVGFDLGTDPMAQTISQIIGAVIGCFVSAIAVLAIIAKYGSVGGTSGLSAAQAHTVNSLIQGIGNPVVFITAMLAGLILYLNKVPAMIFGIGMLLPLGMSTAIFIGGLISLIVKRKNSDDTTGQIISAGLLGGEGLTSTVIAIVQMFL